MTKRLATASVGVLLVCTLAGALSLALVRARREAPASAARASSTSRLAPSERRSVLATLRAMPVSFVPNTGQARRSLRYLAQGAGYGFAFGRDSVRIALVRQSKRGAAAPLRLALCFVGAHRGPEPAGRGRLPGPIDYPVAG